MDFESIVEAFGDGGDGSDTRIVHADLVRILAKLDSLIEAGGAEIRDELPSEAVAAWAKGDLVDAVAAMQRIDPSMSIGDATAALGDALGQSPLVTLLERRVDQLTEMRGDGSGPDAGIT